MSKRYLRQLVETGVVDGWDDPRLPTLCALRRRGYTPESIFRFVELAGICKSLSLVDIALLEHCIRDELNRTAQRRIAILDPIKVEIENYPEDKQEYFEISNNPNDEEAGKRKVLFTKNIYIDKEDFSACPPPKYFRLKPGGEVRLMGGYIIKYKDVVYKEDGSIDKIVCTADIESGNLIRCENIPYTETAEICSVINDLSYGINAFCGDTIYSDIPKNNAGLKLYEKIIGVETTFVESVAEHISAQRLDCQKVAALVEPSQRDYLYEELLKRLGSRFDVTCSAKVLVEVAKLGINKGDALKFLSGRFGVPLEKTVAIGDNLNDLSMVEVAGVGVAVANGDKKLKEVADFIATTNNDGAVAQIIEKYGFA